MIHLQRTLLLALQFSIGCGSVAPGSGSARTSAPIPVATAEASEPTVEQCGPALGVADGSLLSGSSSESFDDEEPIVAEGVWLASGSFVVTGAPADQDGLVQVASPVEGWFQGRVQERCETRLLPRGFPPALPGQGAHVRHRFEQTGSVDGASEALEALVAAHADAHLPPVDLPLDEQVEGEASSVDSYWVVDAARFAVARSANANHDGFAWTSLLASDEGWAVTEIHPHTLDFGAEGSADLDGDGVEDAWVHSESPDLAQFKVSVALSRSRRIVDMALAIEPGVETLLDGCFAYVDGRLSYVLAISRGSESGFHVLQATESGERFEPVAGLVGHVLAAVADDAGYGLSEQSDNDLFQGGDAPLESMMRLCPHAGTAIDVPRDGHYPIDEGDVDTAVVIRVHDLSTSYESLTRISAQDSPPVGPVVEMRTASR